MILAALIPSLLFISLLVYCTVIGTGANLRPKVVSLNDKVKVYGLSIITTKDELETAGNALLESFFQMPERDKIKDTLNPFNYVIITKATKNIDEIEFYVGNIALDAKRIPSIFQTIEIPASTYVSFEVKEKLCLSWKITISRLKKYIYSKWIEDSMYVVDEKFPGEIEFVEKTDEQTISRIILYVAIKRK